MTLTLLTERVPPLPDYIDLRRADIADVLGDVKGATLVHADPPWQYRDSGRNGAAEKHYDVLTMADIAGHLDDAWDSAADDAYLVCWATWPTLLEWMTAAESMRWTYKSGGSWHKTGAPGCGYHLRGNSEPWLLYTKGRPRPVGLLRNAYSSARQEHSQKPAALLSEMARNLGGDIGLVLDLYAGLAPMACACKTAGIRYVGAEIDPDRYASAVVNVARALEHPPRMQGGLFDD